MVPPRIKVTRDDILTAALNLVRQSGIESLNARNLALALGCSTQPIFTHFSTMEELRSAVYSRTDGYQSTYLNEHVTLDQDVMASFAMAYIDFAVAEPNLFRFLTGYDNAEDMAEVVTSDDCNDQALDPVRQLVATDDETANAAFLDMYLYASGLAASLVANQIDLDRDQITSMVTRMGRLLTAAPPTT